jgi:hypothetical protein
VVDEWLSAPDTANYLGITLNNLRQIQHRKNLVFSRKEGRKVYYALADIQVYDAKRKARKAKLL